MRSVHLLNDFFELAVAFARIIALDSARLRSNLKGSAGPLSSVTVILYSKSALYNVNWLVVNNKLLSSNYGNYIRMFKKV